MLSKAMGKGPGARAEDLFRFSKQNLRYVELPEMGSGVYLRDASAREVLGLASLTDEGVDMSERIAAQNTLLAKVVVDESGEPIFTGDQALTLDEHLSGSLYIQLIKAAVEGLSDLAGGEDIRIEAPASGA